MLDKKIINESSRLKLWEDIINHYGFENITEIGVYKAAFTEHMLKNCPSIQKFNMIDPWRNLSDWNKKLNVGQDEFDEILNEVKAKTQFAESKRVILRGKTTEVIDEIEDGSQDYVYIDGDHTLRGIIIDLLRVWNKVKPDGVIAGDDFKKNFWSNGVLIDPTLVLPGALYIAEAMDVKIYGLPFNQFLIFKAEKGFEFIDMTAKKSYRGFDFRKQILSVMKYKTIWTYHNQNLYKNVKKLLGK